ncbi:MAG: transcription initiation factor IIB [Thermoprotei archaeon]|nr:transcription initiation factor IIB [Thermoprotei archaeon]
MGPGETTRECPPDKIIFDPQRGARVCAETGEVLEENIITDEGEWRAYTPEEKAKRARTGGAVSYSKPHMGLDVQVGPYREPGSRKIRGLGKRYESTRIQKTFRLSRLMGSLEKNIASALVIIDDIVAKLELPDSVKEEAARIYREAAQKGLTRGRSVEAMVAASLYAACRRHKVPCSIDEIIFYLKAQETDIKREVARNYRLLVRDLNLNIPVLEPERFVNRIASAMNMPEQVVADAIKIIIEAKKRGVPSGKDPSGLAAAAIYLAALKHGYRKTQKEIAQVAGVTEVTVRNRYKEITQALKIEG